MTREDVPWEYPIRAAQMRNAEGQEYARMGELRDRVLEDHLGEITARINDLELSTDWQIWTPTWTNVVLGTGGAAYGYWRWCNKEHTAVHMKVKTVYGTGSSHTGSIYCDTPPGMTAFTGSNFRSMGMAWYLDSSESSWVTGTCATTSGSNRLYFYNWSVNGVNATTPFPFGSGDELSGDIITEVSPT